MALVKKKEEIEDVLLLLFFYGLCRSRSLNNKNVMVALRHIKYK